MVARNSLPTKEYNNRTDVELTHVELYHALSENKVNSFELLLSYHIVLHMVN